MTRRGEGTCIPLDVLGRGHTGRYEGGTLMLRYDMYLQRYSISTSAQSLANTRCSSQRPGRWTPPRPTLDHLKPPATQLPPSSQLSSQSRTPTPSINP